MVVVFSDIFSDSLSVKSDENIINKDGTVMSSCIHPSWFGNAAAIFDNTGTNAIPADRGIDRKEIVNILRL